MSAFPFQIQKVFHTTISFPTLPPPCVSLLVSPRVPLPYLVVVSLFFSFVCPSLLLVFVSPCVSLHYVAIWILYRRT